MYFVFSASPQTASRLSWGGVVGEYFQAGQVVSSVQYFLLYTQFVIEHRTEDIRAFIQ